MLITLCVCVRHISTPTLSTFSVDANYIDISSVDSDYMCSLFSRCQLSQTGGWMEGQGQGGARGLAHTAGGAAGKDQSQQQVTCRPPPTKEHHCIAVSCCTLLPQQSRHFSPSRYHLSGFDSCHYRNCSLEVSRSPLYDLTKNSVCHCKVERNGSSCYVVVLK